MFGGGRFLKRFIAESEKVKDVYPNLPCATNEYGELRHDEYTSFLKTNIGRTSLESAATVFITVQFFVSFFSGTVLLVTLILLVSTEVGGLLSVIPAIACYVIPFIISIGIYLFAAGCAKRQTVNKIHKKITVNDDVFVFSFVNRSNVQKYWEYIVPYKFIKSIEHDKNHSMYTIKCMEYISREYAESKEEVKEDKEYILEIDTYGNKFDESICEGEIEIFDTFKEPLFMKKIAKKAGVEIVEKVKLCELYWSLIFWILGILLDVTQCAVPMIVILAIAVS